MSKEYFFRIESNLKDEIISIDHKGNFTYGYDSWLIWFDELHYRDEIQSLVKEYGKEMNTYEAFCGLIIWLNNKGVECQTIPKIYYIENNGERDEN